MGGAINRRAIFMPNGKNCGNPLSFKSLTRLSQKVNPANLAEKLRTHTGFADEPRKCSMTRGLFFMP
jgi:hypothetical protein